MKSTGEMLMFVWMLGFRSQEPIKALLLVDDLTPAAHYERDGWLTAEVDFTLYYSNADICTPICNEHTN